MLDGLEPVMGPTRSRELKARLASAIDGNERISAEWEIAVFHCLAQLGELEFPEGATRSADVIFKDRITGERLQVEITAISDRGLHDKNPVEDFSRQINQIVHGLGETVRGAIDYRIGHIEIDNGLILGVPARRDMQAFFQSPEFTGFLSRIRANPEMTHRFDFECRGAKSWVAFRPGAQCASGGHIAHEVILDLQRNHIVGRLKKKDAQIRESGRSLPAIVVLCDGGCRAIRSRMNNPGKPRFDDVVNVFLNGRPQQQAGPWVLQKGISQGSRRINAVIVIAVKEDFVVFDGIQRGYDIRHIMNHGKVYNTLTLKTVELIRDCFKFLPPISSTPVNARRTYPYPPHYGGGAMGAGKGSLMKVKISLLTLQALLSGEISHAEFARDHGDLGKAISKAIHDGMMISKIEIEHCPDEDDDWAHLEFDRPAPDRLFTSAQK